MYARANPLSPPIPCGHTRQSRLGCVGVPDKWHRFTSHRKKAFLRMFVCAECVCIFFACLLFLYGSSALPAASSGVKVCPCENPFSANARHSLGSCSQSVPSQERYEPYCADFGPVNLAAVLRFCNLIETHLSDRRCCPKCFRDAPTLCACFTPGCFSSACTCLAT